MKKKLCLLFFIAALQFNAQITDFETINFQKADSIALVCSNKTLDNLPELSYELTANLPSDAERFRAIYMWVCGNIANDFKLYYKNKRKRKKYGNDPNQLKKWDSQFRKELFKKLVREKTTICTGYAYLIRELATLANIECKIVQGYGRTSTTTNEDLNQPNHSWNAVKLNGKWYLCDATWASGIQNPTTLKFQFQYHEGFFLTNPKLFATNHYPVNEKWLLLEENKPSFQAFIENPIIYNKAYQKIKEHHLPQKMHQVISKNEEVMFQYHLKQSITKEEISLLIDNGVHDKRKQPQNIIIENKTITFTYQFPYTGFYDVHFYIKEHLIATYTFKVKN